MSTNNGIKNLSRGSGIEISLRQLLIKQKSILAGLVIVASVLLPTTAIAQICTPYLASLPKDHRLFLYYPTADDATFPTNTLGNISGVTSQPITMFTSANLDSDLSASSAQLRNRITEQVRDSYCEFSVDVVGQTSEPVPAGTDWQVIGIGAGTSPSNLFGRAQDVDTGNNDPEDYARVWATEFHDEYGGAGDVLSSGNASLERWSAAIAGTTAHEAGHNYGLPHESSAPRAGEDIQNNHLLSTWITGLRGADRVAIRHFSDQSFETLSYNLGLNTKTLSNWDFINPNSSAATGLRIRLLTEADTLALTRVYAGTLSPWTDPSLTQQPGTQNFHGTNYNIFDLEFTTGKTWANGASGVVPAGIKFHVGAGVDSEVLVYDVVMTNAGGDMDLHPRMFGYDFGLASSDSDELVAGNAFIRFFANEEDQDNLLIENVQVIFLPRPVALEQMVEGGILLAEDGLPVQPFTRKKLARDDSLKIKTSVKQDKVGKIYDLAIAHLTDIRHLDLTIKPSAACDENNKTLPSINAGPSDNGGPGEEVYCSAGDYLSLFPATSAYVVADVVDPNAEYFDSMRGRMVTGPLRSTLYAQLAGVIPDFDGNGRDDYLDIREGLVPDKNNNGIPDSAESSGPDTGNLGKWSAYMNVGSNSPSTTVNDSDLSGTIGLDKHFTKTKSIGVRFGYHKFDNTAGGGNLDATEFSLHGEQSFWQKPGFRIFIGGGVGVYSFAPGDTELGLHINLGAGWRFSPAIDLELLTDYHEIINSDTDFGTLLGVVRIHF